MLSSICHPLQGILLNNLFSLKFTRTTHKYIIMNLCLKTGKLTVLNFCSDRTPRSQDVRVSVRPAHYAQLGIMGLIQGVIQGVIKGVI